jgi:DNA-binding response OmpR family regulator/signal transduction histidine kinase
MTLFYSPFIVPQTDMSKVSKTQILIIEDNPGDVDLIREYLKEASIKDEIIHASTFFDGMDTIKSNNISIVLLDLSLPDSSGFKTLSNFLEKQPQVPVIVLTGTNNEIVGNQSIKAGAQDYLVKGQFDGKQLGRSIRYAIQRFKAQQKLEDAAKKLYISESRYLEAQSMANFGNWSMDIVTQKMKWSDEVYRIFNFQPNSISPTYSDYMNYVHLEDKDQVEEFFVKAGKDGKTHKLEHRILVEGKTVKHVIIQAKINFDQLTDKFWLLGGVQDITERKVSEQFIIEKNINQKVSKIKDEALADLSFHIRTPLSSIVNLLFLLENTGTSKSQAEYVDGLKTSVDDLSIMVNNLLNFSVLVSEKITLEEEELQIVDFLKSTKRIVNLKGDKTNQTIEFELDENLPEKIISDQKKLTQLLYNLIDFSSNRTVSNGNIHVQVIPKDITDSEMKLSIHVSDNGETISKARTKELLNTDQLLENYSDEMDDAKKDDLGMAIVAKLVEIMKGEISIESKEGKGTQFKIELPIKIVKPISLTPGDAPDSPLKILLVEDHFLNQIATKKILTTWTDKITVDIAENGLIAVEKFREHGYDLVLMDMQMPVMNGLDSSKKIRENSTVPIIALTANASKQEADKCYAIGINAYLTKPFKPQDLYAKIMSLMIAVDS